jgi:hypothetical protein
MSVSERGVCRVKTENAQGLNRKLTGYGNGHIYAPRKRSPKVQTNTYVGIETMQTGKPETIFPRSGDREFDPARED